jgi:hypothetical protein
MRVLRQESYSYLKSWLQFLITILVDKWLYFSGKEEIACRHLIPPAAKKKEVYGKHLCSDRPNKNFRTRFGGF